MKSKFRHIGERGNLSLLCLVLPKNLRNEDGRVFYETIILHGIWMMLRVYDDVIGADISMENVHFCTEAT